MKRPSAYGDPNVNPYATSEMQHMSAQRIVQHNAAMNNFPVEKDAKLRFSRIDGQWQRNRDAPKLPNQMPSNAFNQVQGLNTTRSYYQRQALDSLENSANVENNAQSQEQDMEIGYEDNPSPLTFEGLERKFHDEIMKLVKEQSDTEDKENARHKKKIMEINTRYQEKLSALRAQHTNRREEVLRKESQARLHQYQQAGISSHPNSGLQDGRGYGGTAVAAAGGETRGHTTGQFDSYRDQSQFNAGQTMQGSEVRVPYPEGHFNNTSAQYF
ncbi:uncharacterized protein LOC110425853 [Herrania umbratica]|uniref:Uncharacterized protein LOC110425853 n=1 Tax=Herrania umbratica TaxID=108875 RepID=A0A6J1BE05_9ROSI|nr:uncharacterized protein LOC110425853 [Herrania umbratica]XP_021296590.1 uncharacterized protein LOC110425853 [Herrania umbratica]